MCAHREGRGVMAVRVRLHRKCTTRSRFVLYSNARFLGCRRARTDGSGGGQSLVVVGLLQPLSIGDVKFAP